LQIKQKQLGNFLDKSLHYGWPNVKRTREGNRGGR